MAYNKRNTSNVSITGTRVEVKHNNIEFALKKFKNKIKDFNLMLELRDRQYYKKKSDINREKRNSIKTRYKYKQEKENN
jgi:ribosomal protein S21